VPPHAVRTGEQPMVRFIGSDDVDESEVFFQVWREKLAQWQAEGDTLFFIHTPDMGQVFPLVQRLWPQLQAIDAGIGSGPAWPQQASLF